MRVRGATARRGRDPRVHPREVSREARAEDGLRDRNDHGRRVSDQFGGQFRQSFKATIGRNIFDRNVAAFDIAGYLEPLAESAELVIMDDGAAK